MEINENYIPIDRTLMVLYIFTLLNEYDIALKNGDNPKIDPYRSTLYMETDNNKYVEIPEDLRKYAILQWLQNRKIKPRYDNYVYTEEHVPVNNSSKNEKCKTCRKDIRHRDYTLVDTTFQLILCLIIIFTIFYILGLIRRGVVHF